MFCSVETEEEEEGFYSFIDELDVNVTSVPLSVTKNPMGTSCQSAGCGCHDHISSWKMG